MWASVRPACGDRDDGQAGCRKGRVIRIHPGECWSDLGAYDFDDGIHRGARSTGVLTTFEAQSERSGAGSGRIVALDRSHSVVLGRLYEDHAEAIFRALRRWGVSDASANDALQEVS